MKGLTRRAIEKSILSHKRKLDLVPKLRDVIITRHILRDTESGTLFDIDRGTFVVHGKIAQKIRRLKSPIYDLL